MRRFKMGSAFGLIAITYGIPGIAVCLAIGSIAYARKNETKINKNKNQLSKIIANQEEMTRKINLIGDHFMIEGMKK
jgi:hypothetical protein